MVLKIIFIAFILLVPITSYSAKFTTSSKGEAVEIKGEIVKGDFDEFLKEYKNAKYIHNKYPDLVRIDSPGGNLYEAFLIAETIEKANLSTVAWRQCNSACAFILIAGKSRASITPIGLHRPYYDPKYFGKLKMGVAEEKFTKLVAHAKEWLAERYVPQEVIEGLVHTPSFKIKMIPADRFINLIGKNKAFYQEWITAKCGRLTESERRDFDAIGWLNFEIKQGRPVKSSSLAADVAHAKKLSEPYRNYLKSKGDNFFQCVKSTNQKVRKQLFDS